MPVSSAQDYRRVRSALRFVTDYPSSGSHFFASSVTGSDATGYGYTPDAPCATLDYAVGLCTADKGDVIHLLPGHTETKTAAAQVVLDVAGVTVVGEGNGSLKPTIKLGTATTADVDVDADNVTIKNVRFQSDIDDLAVMLDVNEDYCTFEDCEFIGPATKECLNFVNLATTKDNFVFRRCRWLQEADPAGTDGAAATGGIYLVDTENVLVEDCTFNGFFETAPIHNKTTACKYLTVRRTSTNQQLTVTGKRFVFPAGTVGVQIDYNTDPCFTPGLGYRVTKTEDVNTATSDNLFDLTGKVNITLWTGEVTNALDAAVSDYQITLTTLAGVLVAAGNIASAIVGHIFTLNHDAGDTALSTSTSAVSVAGVGDSQGKSGFLVVGKAGGTDVIKSVRTAGASGDAIIHTVYYVPLEPGAGLVDAA
jgi:hypothetical protein